MGISDSIKKMVGEQLIVLVNGIVKSVDKNTDTCVVSPMDGGADFLDVKIAPVSREGEVKSDIVYYPKIGSIVNLGLFNNDALDTFLISSSSYESVLIKVAENVNITATDNGLLIIDANKITLNGGKNGGLVNITPLIKKINTLEKTVNNLLAVFKSHVHTGVTTGAGVSGVTLVTTPASIAPLTKISDLEDTAITH